MHYKERRMEVKSVQINCGGVMLLLMALTLVCGLSFAFLTGGGQ